MELVRSILRAQSFDGPMNYPLRKSILLMNEALKAETIASLLRNCGKNYHEVMRA